MDSKNKILLICKGVTLADDVRNNVNIPEKFRVEATHDLNIFLNLLAEHFTQEVLPCHE